MPARPVYVLGTGLSHDGSACLLKDGRIAIAIEKERLTRRKHDGGNDEQAIRYCLEAEGLELSDVDLVVQNANFSMLERGNDWFRGPRSMGRHPRVVTLSHHLAHAYSAIATCPFDECAVLVVDGCGNAFDECLDREAARSMAPPHDAALDHLHFEKDSYYHFDGRRLQPIAKDYSPWGKRLREYPMLPGSTLHSIGGLYQAASHYCLGGIDDSGKLMGLAPYGRPGAHREEIFRLDDGRVLVNEHWMRRFNRPYRDEKAFARDFAEYADIARWVQDEVERALLYLVRARHALHPSRHLAYAGGVALNAVANRRILQEGPFQALHVQPAAGDNGLALGCAVYGWMEVLGRERVLHDGSAAFGRPYAESEIMEALRARSDAITSERFDGSAALVDATAQLLADGCVVGWFQGGSEFGPRALGHRSILADPRRGGLRERINRHVKFREDFRPFAPSVTREFAESCFEMQANPQGPGDYMLMVVPVREGVAPSLPDITHVDGSCRPQAVSAQTEPLFHALLEAFAKRSGLPVLLNTSLNRRGMPIVETPAETVDFFLNGALDALVIASWIVRKTHRPDRSDPSAAATATEDAEAEAGRKALDELTRCVRRYGHTLRLRGVCEIRLHEGVRHPLALGNALETDAAALIVTLDARSLVRLVGERGACAQSLIDAGALTLEGPPLLFAGMVWMLQQG